MLRLNRKNWREIFNPDFNPVIKALTISDILILSGFGLVSPVFAVYLADYIPGGNLEVVGLAATIYLLTKSLAQLPAAQVIDLIRGERDDFLIMLIGSIMTSLVPLFYLIAKTPAHIYLIQFFYGLSQALTFPSWLAIFTRHVDPQKEGIEWGLYYTLTDLFGAGAAAVGGVVANYLGFLPLFVMVSLFSFAGSTWLLFIHHEMKH